MGAWDSTAFGNDDAADWAFELRTASNPAKFVAAALSLAGDDGYLHAHEACQIVAAAAIVGAARGEFELPEDLAAWLRGKQSKLKDLADEALAGIQRVRGEESELKDQWRESGGLAGWSADLDAITVALR